MAVKSRRTDDEDDYEDDEEDEPRPARSRGRRHDDDDDDDDDDDYDRPRRRRSRHYDDNDAVSTIIPYRNPMALASYYLGFFSLIPILGILLALAGIVLGILGLRYRSQNPRAKGAAHAITGIILSAIFLIINPIICFFLYKANR